MLLHVCKGKNVIVTLLILKLVCIYDYYPQVLSLCYNMPNIIAQSFLEMQGYFAISPPFVSVTIFCVCLNQR